MIYLLRKHDIISVPFIREAYIICEADIIASAISPVRAKERISLKKVSFVSRQKRLFSWRARRDSEPRTFGGRSPILTVSFPCRRSPIVCLCRPKRSSFRRSAKTGKLTGFLVPLQAPNKRAARISVRLFCLRKSNQKEQKRGKSN